MITIDEIKMTKYANLLHNIPKEYVTSNTPLPFECNELKMFNQGIMLYETEIPKAENTYIKMVVHDFALVYLGDQIIQVLDRTKLTNHGFTIKK